MNKKIKFLTIVILIFIILMSAFGINWIIVFTRQTELDVWKSVGMAGYMGTDIYETIREVIPQDKAKLMESAQHFFDSHEVEPYVYPSKKPVENIILIQLEGIDSVAIDMEKNHEKVMPNLSQLKNNGIWFENVFDQTGVGRTSDGEFLALTSLCPIKNESMYTNYDLQNILSLPKIMDKCSKETIAVHGNQSDFWNRQESHTMLGYQTGVYAENIETELEKNYQGWGFSDRTVLSKTYEIIKTTAPNVFTHTILLTGHHPYDAVNMIDMKLPYSEPQTIIESYINCLYYTDYAIGEFIEELRDSDILDKSLIIIFSDHDSGITEDVYDYMGLPYDQFNIDCDKVPLIIYDGVNQLRDETFMGQADIMPLILSYLDIELPKTIMGANFINGEKAVYLQDGLVVGDKVLQGYDFDINTITRTIVKWGDEFNE